MSIHLMCADNKHAVPIDDDKFDDLRRHIAELANPELGKHYKTFSEIPLTSDKRLNAQLVSRHLAAANNLVRYKKSLRDVARFLYASKSGADLPWTTCRELLDVLKDYEDTEVYGEIPHPRTKYYLGDVKTLLAECVSLKSKICW